MCVNSKLLKHINRAHIQHQLQTSPISFTQEAVKYVQQHSTLQIPSSFDWEHFFEYTQV